MCTKLIRLLKKDSENNLKKISATVNSIIKDNIKDKKIIENTLDNLLDLLYILEEQKIYPIYYKLLTYYKSIDLEASMDY